MKYQVNQKVKTPLGEGIVQGAFAVEGKSGEGIITGVAVRLPVNDLTRDCLGQSNCMTPRAMLSGVWVFDESELK